MFGLNAGWAYQEQSCYSENVVPLSTLCNSWHKQDLFCLCSEGDSFLDHQVQMFYDRESLNVKQALKLTLILP